MKFASPLFLLLLGGLLHATPYFEPNRGQSHTTAKFIGRTPHGLAAVDATRLNLRTARGAAIEVNLDSANPDTAGTGVDPLPGVSHYALSRDPSSWIFNVPHFASVEFREVYKNVALRWHYSGNDIEFDFDVARPADASRIRLSFNEDFHVSAQGDIELSQGQIRRPVAWQTIDGKRHPVDVSFRSIDGRHVGFLLGPNNPSAPVVIDPTIDFASYLGGSGVELDTQAAVDSAGNIYMAGTTFSTDFPASELPGYPLNTPESLRNADVYVTRLKPDASTIEWSFFIGGTASERCAGIELDSIGDLYVYGATTSANFPVTPGAWKTSIDASLTDTFVAKFNAQTGMLVASTYLGLPLNYNSLNPNASGAFAVDSAGGVYASGITGSSFQPTPGSYSSNSTASPGAYATWGIVRLNSSLSNVVYATYLPLGSPALLRADANGNLIMTGITGFESPGPPFPAVNPITGVDQTPGFNNGFIAKLNPSGSTLVYASLLAGNATDLEVDASGNAWVAGYAGAAMPQVNPLTLVPAPSGQPASGSTMAFVAEVPPQAGTFLQSTLFYGSAYPGVVSAYPPFMKLVFPSGRLCVTGIPISSQTPGGLGISSSTSGAPYSLVCADNAGSTMAYLSGLPGAGLIGYSSAQPTPDGAILLAGTTNEGFPVTPGVVQQTYAGAPFSDDPSALNGGDSFIVRVSLPNPVPVLSSVLPDSVFVNSYNASGSTWNFTVNGSGFAYGEQLSLDGQPAPAPAFNSLTQLALSDIPSTAIQAGANQIVATMSGPGGGVSNPVTVTGYNPAPASISLTPSSLTAGAAETKVVVSGSGIISSSVLTWNGQVRPTTFVPASSGNSGTLQFLLEPSELSQASVSTAAVSNPAPGGGTSPIARFVVQSSSGNSVPSLSLTPIVSIFSDSTPVPTTIVLAGSSFTASTTATWDGVPVPVTFLTASQLRITPPSGSLSVLGSHQVQVSNGSFSSAVVPVLVVRFFGNRLASFTAFDPVKQVVYALLQPAPPATAYDLAIYDARTGADAGSVPGIMTQASAIAVSDDGSYVYVAGGASWPEIKRYNTETASVDLDFQLQLPATVTQASIEAVATVTGSPETIAVSVTAGTTPAELYIYDRDQPRPLWLQLTASATSLFATANKVFLTSDTNYPCFQWVNFDAAGANTSSGQCGMNPPELRTSHGFAWLTDGARSVTVNAPYGAGNVAYQQYTWTVDPPNSVAYALTNSSPYPLLQMNVNTLAQQTNVIGSAALEASIYIATNGDVRLVSSDYLVAPLASVPGEASGLIRRPPRVSSTKPRDPPRWRIGK